MGRYEPSPDIEPLGRLGTQVMDQEPLRSKVQGRPLVTALREQSINGLPGLIDGGIELAPPPFDAKVRFIHARGRL
jgi:hypothetical protein